MEEAKMHRPGIEPGAGRHLGSEDLWMATANFTTKPPMLLYEQFRQSLFIILSPMLGTGRLF
jgi:hypothetical protein